MRKNLVTGGSGFLGSHLIDALLERGESVVSLVRPSSDTTYLESIGVELALGDISDLPSIKKAAQGVDFIYHCAALAADWGTWDAFREANKTGVQNMLDAALEANVDKFIHVSTTDVYGHPNYPVDEGSPFRLRGWPYGDTKIEGEKVVWEYLRKHDVPATIVRPVNIYGPRSTTFVLEIVELLKKGEMVHIGFGRQSAGLVYVTNVVDLMLRAADSDRSVGQAYNASDGSNVTWREYVDRLAAIVGVKSPRLVIPHRFAFITGWTMELIYKVLRIKTRPLLTRMAAELFGTDQGFPITKARNELGYSPGVDFDQGMRRVEEWLHKTGNI